MRPDDRPFLGVYLAVGIVTLIAIGFGGLIWPNDAPPGPSGPLVHVTNVRWSITGCGLVPFAGTGGTVSAGDRLTVGATLGNASLARSCLFGPATSATTGFSVVNGTLSIQLPEDEMTAIYVTVLTPPTFWTGTLNLTVSAAPVG
jgi:hypothetical protein